MEKLFASLTDFQLFIFAVGICPALYFILIFIMSI